MHHRFIMRFLYIALFMLLACGQNAHAVAAFPKLETEVSPEYFHPKKQKQKRGLRQWLKAKFAKRSPAKERKNRYGRLAMLVLLGGIVLLVVTDAFFALSLLASMILGIVGLFKDEKKLLAILALALPLAFLIIAAIQIASIFG